MLHFFAQIQPAAPEATDWKFWVMAVIAIFSLIEMIFQPIIGWLLKQVMGRLKDGDAKFETHSKTLTEVVTKLDRVESDVTDIKSDVKEANEQMHETGAEGQGTVNELRVEIERNFVRNEKFDRLTERIDRQHGEVMQAIRDMERR